MQFCVIVFDKWYAKYLPYYNVLWLFLMLKKLQANIQQHIKSQIIFRPVRYMLCFDK